MNKVLFVLCLASTASALNILQNQEQDASEGTEEGTEVTQTCKEGIWRWEKRNSSALRESPKKVKKIYYINVDGSDERKRHMQAELSQKSHGTKYERFPAFKAEDVPKHEKSPTFKKVASLYSKARYTPWLLRDASKEVFAAIHISNYQVMEKILKEDPLGEKSDEVYMVLEDDTKLMENWDKKIPQILANTPAEWDILRVGYWGFARCGDRENNFVYAIQPPAKDDKALAGAHFYSGNTGYLVRPKSIPRILDIMRNSSFASIENVFMYPHRFPDGTDQQIMSYAVAPEHMIVQSDAGALFTSSHGRR
jgi:GR25 family glycosyltransferase involved in LPS biosynthesis